MISAPYLWKAAATSLQAEILEAESGEERKWETSIMGTAFWEEKRERSLNESIGSFLQRFEIF